MLASSSPRRIRLLSQEGLLSRVVALQVPEVAESKPERTAVGNAFRKAAAAAARGEEGLLLGVDTVVALGRTQLGKPACREEARATLALLSGRRHLVVSGMALIDTGRKRKRVGAVRSFVRFRRLSVTEVEAYLDTGEYGDKAGAYGIQGRAAALVEEVEGSITNVIGLPMEELRSWLDSR